jgi:transposase
MATRRISAIPDGKVEGSALVMPLACRDRVDVPTAKGRAERRSCQKVANLPSAVSTADVPTRSVGAIESGTQGRSAMRSVALDLGSKVIAYCEIAGGQVVQRGTVSSLELLEPVLGPQSLPARVAIEACREAWVVHARLTQWGNEVLLVDTTRSKQLGLGQHRRKNDRIDAEVLARAVERGSIPLAHLLSPHRRELRRQLGVRRALVETRTQYVTTCRGLVREQGESLPSCETAQFVVRVRSAHLTAEVHAVIEPLLGTLTTVETQLACVEQRLVELCAQEPVVVRLTTVPGVGLIVAACFVSVIDDAHRFSHAHQVESYIGLVPSEDSSGGKRRLGAISKRGNSYLRAMLVQASWIILRTKTCTSEPLHRWGQAVAARRGNRIAVVALARRLAGVLWAIWRDDTVYEPDLIARTGARGLRRAAQNLEYRASKLDKAAQKVRRNRARAPHATEVNSPQ